jgi:hypothetical protein
MLTPSSGQWLGWTGLIRVDGNTFVWMGAPDGYKDQANQTSYEYTSTKSIFTLTANDQVQLKVTFLSPLTPNDLKRQSLIFSYMEVEVSSMDGSQHDVQIYTDISAGEYRLSYFHDTVRLICRKSGRLVMLLPWLNGALALRLTVYTTTRSGSRINKSSTKLTIERNGETG